MKKHLCILIFLVMTLISCDYTNQIKEQLSFLMNIRKDFGGSWNSSFENGCFKIEITNSNRINNNQDSLDFYGAIIGREFIKSNGLQYSCMTLNLVNENNFVVFSNSTTNTVTYDLKLINRFKDVPLYDYLIVRKAILSSQNADNENIVDAMYWLNDLDSISQNHPFIILARAHIARANGENILAETKINYLINNYDQNDLLFQYIGIYYLKTKELKKTLNFFKLSSKLNKENIEHLFNLSSIYYQLKNYDSSIIKLTKIIKKDSLNLRAYFNRADCNFKLGFDTLGCKDVNKILTIEPKAGIPDSIIKICKLVNH